MSNPSEEHTTELNHVRYARLFLKYKTAEEKIQKLKRLIEEEDSSLTKERFYKLLAESEQITIDIKPELDSIKKEIDKELYELNKIENSLQEQINDVEKRIEETKQLYSQNIIDKGAYQTEIKQYKAERDPLLANLKKNKSKINEIENALHVRPSLGHNLKKMNWGNTKKDGENYFSKVKNSENYFIRLGNTILFIQALCLLMFVVFRFLWMIDFEKLIPITALFFLVIGIFIILQFLILSSVKANAGTYFGSAILYFFISLFLFSKTGPFYSILDLTMASTFLGLMASWNMIFSIIIFVIGCTRTFLLGIVHDYKTN